MNQYAIALEINGYVHAYNTDKQEMLCVAGYLHNYSDNFVAVKRLNNKSIDIYDKDRKLVYTYPNDFIDISNIAGIIF